MKIKNLFVLVLSVVKCSQLLSASYLLYTEAGLSQQSSLNSIVVVFTKII